MNGPLEFLHKLRCPTENFTTEGIKHEYKLIEDKCYFIQIMSRTFKKTQEFCETVFEKCYTILLCNYCKRQQNFPLCSIETEKCQTTTQQPLLQ